MGKRDWELPSNNDETVTAVEYSRKIATISQIIRDNFYTEQKHDKKLTEAASEVECDFETAISATGYGKFNYLLLVSIIPSAISSLVAATAMSYILPSAECDLNLTNLQKGLLNSITYIGMISSAFMWGFLSDTLGRRRILLFAHFFEAIFGISVGLSQDLESLLAMKLLSGFISSAPYPLMMTYLAETNAAKFRPSIMLWTGVYMAIGMVLIPVTAWIIIPNPIKLVIGPFYLPTWRLYLLGCAIPSILGFFIILTYHESPKFLMACGRKEEALEVFRQIYVANTGKPKHTYPVKALIDNKNKVMSSKTNSPWMFMKLGWNQVKPLFQKPHLKHAVLCFTLQLGTMAGLNTLRLWLPQLFSSIINSEEEILNNWNTTHEVPTTICQLLVRDSTTIVATNITDCSLLVVEDRVYSNSIIVGAVTGLGYLTTSYMIHLLGKKWLMCLLYTIGSGLCISMYWITSSLYMTIVSSFFISFVSTCSTIVVSVIVDLFPTTLRTMSVSLSLMIGRMGAMTGNLVFPLLLDYNCDIPFFLIAGIILCTALLTMMVPNTTGKDQE